MNLNLYFILFSIRKGRDWSASASYIFAKSEESVCANLEKKYGEVRVRSITPIEIEEGTILYGERWHKL